MSDRLSVLYYVPPGLEAPDGLRRLRRLARRRQARLTLVAVVPRAPRWVAARLPGAPQVEAMAVEHQQQQLERVAGRLRSTGLECVSRVLVGDPGSLLLSAIDEQGHDLLVIGAGDTRQHDLVRDLMRRSPVPVWVLPAPLPRLGRVVVAVDPQLDRQHQRQLIRLARERARSSGASLTIVHTWEVLAGHLLASRHSAEDHQALLDLRRSTHRQALARLVDSVPGPLADERLELLEGHHGQALEAHLRQHPADLLVLGSAGRQGLLAWLRGNTAERLLRNSRTALLVVPQLGRLSATGPAAPRPLQRAAG